MYFKNTIFAFTDLVEQFIQLDDKRTTGNHLEYKVICKLLKIATVFQLQRVNYNWQFCELQEIKQNKKQQKSPEIIR